MEQRFSNSSKNTTASGPDGQVVGFRSQSWLCAAGLEQGSALRCARQGVERDRALSLDFVGLFADRFAAPARVLDGDARRGAL